MTRLTRTLRGFSDVFEAEIIRDRLAAANIRAFVTGTDMATALSLGGAATSNGVRLEVANDDYDRAVATLADDEKRLREAGDWQCGRCSEPNEASFEVCWSCNKPRSDDDKRTRFLDTQTDTTESAAEGFGDIEVVAPDASSLDDRNPYRPVLVDESAGKDTKSRNPDAVVVTNEELDDQVRRVMVAAAASTMLLPPVSTVYVVSLLWRLPKTAYQDPSRRQRIQIAWWITMLGGFIGVGYLLIFFG
ncbi:putative signal transducing protein [Rubripirellula reticaptiva]|uniref:RanBP2-type domain-containing protein n=1 Tax=Rubripirellula reticaptiva TaxID=2528013 RepID=A0A5C6F0A3_9BACT|nr:DUF2007 domain-containing protein [Rubripirellula reticaptiva]TWU55303.1 hypothetical protein Poly59_16000 [Rubripirellula reticaptiva]